MTDSKFCVFGFNRAHRNFVCFYCVSETVLDDHSLFKYAYALNDRNRHCSSFWMSFLPQRESCWSDISIL